MFVCVCVKFAGKWYRVGLAYESASFIPYRDKLKASMGIVTALANGNVNLTMWDATWVHVCATKVTNKGRERAEACTEWHIEKIVSLCFPLCASDLSVARLRCTSMKRPTYLDSSPISAHVSLCCFTFPWKMFIHPVKLIAMQTDTPWVSLLSWSRGHTSLEGV